MLSAEQQSIIENSIWVVNSALKKQNLSYDEDLRQSAILYMCRCLEKFDPSKNIKWTTFAYKNVYLFIKRKNRKDKLKASYQVQEDVMFDIMGSYDVVEVNESVMLVRQIYSTCTPIEKKILLLKLKQYRIKEISATIGYSQSTINNCLRSIKEKARKIKEGEKDNNPPIC